MPGHISKRQQKKASSEKANAIRRGRLSEKAKRQHGKCWFCNEHMGFDCTREHLLAKARGGTDDPANIRAAHADCNSAAGHLPVKLKYELRRIGHAAGRGAMIEAAHRMRRHQTKEVFRLVSKVSPGGSQQLIAKDANKATIANFQKVSSAEKQRRRQIARDQQEAAQRRREQSEKYWKKLGLSGKPSWWDE